MNLPDYSFIIFLFSGKRVWRWTPVMQARASSSSRSSPLRSIEKETEKVPRIRTVDKKAYGISAVQ
jgi:hypothetical protein